MTNERIRKKLACGKSCIVVDDDESVCIILSHMLQAFGCNVEFTTDDGRLALRYLQQHQVDAVFLDLQMDKLSGKEALRLIKEQNAKQIVVIISGDVNRAKQIELEPLGANAVIQKPFDLDLLEDTLNGLKLLC